MRLTSVDLFSGIGAMALAEEAAGFEILLGCEIEPFCRTILKAKLPKVPIVEDVHHVTGQLVASRFLAEGIEDPLTLVVGAFPVQANFSRGERRENDPRSLWDQFTRVSLECRPAWVVVETFPRLSNLGLDDAAWDLEREGYATTAVHLPAQAVGCPLRKDRLYMVAARRDDPGTRPDEPGSELDIPRRGWAAPGPRLHRMAQRPARDLDEHLALLHTIGDATVPPAAHAILGSIAASERDWIEAGAGKSS